MSTEQMVLRNHLCETFGFTPKNSIRMPFLGYDIDLITVSSQLSGDDSRLESARLLAKKHKILALEQLQNAEKISI